MECIVDFKVVWPLLRKEGWTWKPAKGLQIHSNYLKSGCKLRGGKPGVDFFNGEDALLAYVKADKDMCTRLRLANIMVRPHAESTEPAGPTAPSTPKKPSKRQDFVAEGGPKKKRPKTGTTTKKSEAKGTRKTPSKTKKQQADEAAERRRKHSSFTKVWGATNAQVSDGRRVEAPHAFPSIEAGATSNADTDGM
ncbi:hypothetical protein L915_12391 [Phytophthora nicotianae]|uniref:Uncharacterized protein n=2 Tax=Phytophthora nicotianae TaxID=4792 RepID=W2GGQ6_PHYNI|nr:hypothetical protein L915_12391 [Phytophthora nicotianae]